MMYPTTDDVRKKQFSQTEEHLQDVSLKLDDIKTRIQRIQKQQHNSKNNNNTGK